MKLSTQRGQEMPVVYRHILKTDWLRTFSFKERVKILLGCSLVVAVRIVTQHSPGKIQPVIAGEVSDATEPSERLRTQLDNILVPQQEEK